MASYSSNNNNNNINNSEPQETETERWKSERPSSRTAVPGCLATFWAEVNPCQDWYLVSDTVTGRKLDVQHTFGPVGRYALLLKLLGTGFCISTLIYSLIDAVNSSVSSWFWWFAYYPNWSIIISCLYQILSFSNSLFSERITQPPARVTGCCKVTWILFSMASNANLVAVLVFWLLLYNPNDESSTSAINYLNIARYVPYVYAFSFFHHTQLLGCCCCWHVYQNL